MSTNRICGVPIYPTFVNLPASSLRGALAVTSDSGDLYEFNGTTWDLLAQPGGGGIVTIGDFNADGPTPEGLSFDGTALSLAAADASHPGGVSTSSQHFAGLKTFNNGLSTDGANIIMTDGSSAYGKLYFDSTAYIGKEFGVIALRHQDFQVPDGQIYAATIHADHLDVDSQINVYNGQITPHTPFIGNGFDFNKPIYMAGHNFFMGLDTGMGTGGGNIDMEGGTIFGDTIQADTFSTTSGFANVNNDGSVVAKTITAQNGLFAGTTDDSSGHIIQSTGTAAFSATGDTHTYTIDAPASASVQFVDVGAGEIVDNGYSWQARIYAYKYTPDGIKIFSATYAETNLLTDPGTGLSSYDLEFDFTLVTGASGYFATLYTDDPDYGYNFDLGAVVESPFSQSAYDDATVDFVLNPTSHDLLDPALISTGDAYFNAGTFFQSGHYPYKVAIPGHDASSGYDMLIPYNCIFGDPNQASLRFGYSYSDPFSGDTAYTNFESNTTTSPGGTAFDISANNTGSRMRFLGEGGIFFRTPYYDTGAMAIDPTGVVHVGNAAAFDGYIKLNPGNGVATAQAINLTPTTDPPILNPDGQIYYDSVAKHFYGRVDGVWKQLDN